MGDLYALTGPESKNFEQWTDASSLAEKVGGTDSYPSSDLVLVGPGEESGTYDYWVEAVIEPIAEERKIPEDDWATRPDYQSSPNDNVIIENVADNPTSLGWVGYAYYKQNEGSVKAIEVDGGDGCTAPNEETISNASYPISRYLYFYVNKQKLASNDALRAYADLYLSDEGIASVTEVGYVALHPDDLQATREVWDSEEAGSRDSA
jgi:phosphate transport system substrate-binding protein